MTIEAIQDYLENNSFYPTVDINIASGGNLNIKDFYINEFGHEWTCAAYNYETCEAEFYCEELSGSLHGVIRTKQTVLGTAFKFIIHYCD